MSVHLCFAAPSIQNTWREILLPPRKAAKVRADARPPAACTPARVVRGRLPTWGAGRARWQPGAPKQVVPFPAMYFCMARWPPDALLICLPRASSTVDGGGSPGSKCSTRRFDTARLAEKVNARLKIKSSRKSRTIDFEPGRKRIDRRTVRVPSKVINILSYPATLGRPVVHQRDRVCRETLPVTLVTRTSESGGLGFRIK